MSNGDAELVSHDTTNESIFAPVFKLYLENSTTALETLTKVDAMCFPVPSLLLLKSVKWLKEVAQMTTTTNNSKFLSLA